MLSNKVVLVTGGTGAIGEAICRTLAREGADVAFTYLRKKEKAEALAADLGALGRRCLFGKVDGCDSPAVQAFVDSVESELERIDVLVNCLGMIQVMPFALIDEEDWDRIIQVNLKGMFLFTKATVRGMIGRRSGVVLNIGSIAGHRMVEVPVHYATSKAAVVGFTTSLAKELCRYGIRVNALAPGLIQGGIGFSVTDEQLGDYKRFCAAGRPGTPDEVAEVVAFLASDRSAYINAQNIVIDGGL